MVNKTLEPRLGEILEPRSVRGNVSYWSSSIAANQLSGKTGALPLNTTPRNNLTTYSLREAIYRANQDI